MELTRDPLPGLMRQIAAPAAVAMLLQTVLNLTDTWFAGRVSTLAQAALSLSFPLFFVLFTFGAGLSTGTSALVGRALGAGDERTARCLAGQAVILSAAVGLALAVLGPLISRPAFRSMGATEGEYLSLCLDYMDVIFLFSPIFLLQSITNSFLTTQGDSRSMRNALAAAVVVNFFLDWWFVEGGFGLPALGVMGLALATGLVQVGSLFYMAWRVKRTCLFRRGFWPALRPRWALQKELIGQVVPPSLNQASVGLGIYVINWFVGRFGPGAIAAYGVAVRLEQVALLPALAVSMATLPLTAQNDGAGFFRRALETRALAVKWGARFSVVAMLALIFGGYYFMGFISTDEAVRAEGALFLKFDALAFFAYVLLYVNVAFLQGLKRPMFAIWIGLYRQIAAPILVFWLLAYGLNLGTLGIWMGIAAVTISGAVVSEIYVRRVVAGRLAAEQSQG